MENLVQCRRLTGASGNRVNVEENKIVMLCVGQMDMSVEL